MFRFAQLLAPVLACAVVAGAAQASAGAREAQAMGFAGAPPTPPPVSRGRATPPHVRLRRGSVLLAFLPTGEPRLAAVPGLSIGILSASQGSYSPAQLLLDITQGGRVASSAYSHSRPPAMTLRTLPPGGFMEGWPNARRRAEDAPQLLRPGLLASQIPGGGAYVGIDATDDLDAIAAADRDGRVATVSIGTPASLSARVERLLASRRLVVADLPTGAPGANDLRRLAERRRPGQLLIVVQRARTPHGHELLWLAAAGLPGPPGTPRQLTSPTTNQRGLVAAMDIAPTILVHLGLAVPADVRGRTIEPDGSLDGASLRTFRARLQVLGGRRLSALGWLLCAWALMLLACAAHPRARSWAMRAGALGVLWAPVAVLIPAVLAPSAAVEYATIALTCLALGAVTDRALPWPRAPLAPACVAVLVLSIDALAGTQLLVRSLLGPNPALGARFYGFGNELKSGLAVLTFAAVAAALYPATRGRRAALAMVAAGVLLAAIEGSARVGAGVGGVILVSAGTAVATILLLPGAVTRRRVLIVLVAPVLALVALALLDLLTAHGSGHFTGSILHARSPADLRDVLVRRYKAAWDELGNHAMPIATALALLGAFFGVRDRRRLLAPVSGDPGWLAALAGGLAAGLVGALAEDSGPVLLLVAVFALGCVLAYLWGSPQLDASAAEEITPRSPGTSRAARSRARTRSAEPAR